MSRTIDENFVKFREVLSSGLKVCVIMRGLPGRGKSTYAERIQAFVKQLGHSVVLSAADDYMVNIDGDYQFDPKRLSKAHTLCNKKLIAAMVEGVDVVCQHNTNMQRWESAALRANALELGYLVVFMEPPHAWTPVEEMPAELRGALVSIHGVPEKAIQDMAARKEDFFPRYLGYWFPSCALLEKVDTIPNCIDALSDNILNCFPELSNRPLFNILAKLLHITTDFIGDDKKILEGRLADLKDHLLASLSVRVVAIFADADLGIGALVAPVDRSIVSEGIERYEMFTNFAVSRSPTPAVPSTALLHGRVPNRTLSPPAPAAPAHHSKHLSSRGHAPHITLYTRENRSNAEVGTAAYEFRELLLREQLPPPPAATTGSGQVDPFRVATLGKFTAIIFNRDLILGTTYAANYTDVTANKLRHFSWVLEDKEEEEVFCDLIAKHGNEVSFVETPVPAAILPAYNSGTATVGSGSGRHGKPPRLHAHPHWVLADVRLKGAKGKPDDELYDESDFLRRFMPRGYCYLVSPERVATKALLGLSKFTGDEDDEIASREEDGTEDVAAKYFSRPLSTLQHPRIVAMEKANGESAHGTFLRIHDTLYVLTGSKGVHLLIRYGVPGDIDLYSGPRFNYAKEIATIFLATFDAEKPEVRALIERMVAQRLTAVFEYEDPAHAHIIPLARRRLKFITFVRNGLHHKKAAAKRCSEIAMAPDVALRIAEEAGLDTVWHFNAPISQLGEVKQMILSESTLKMEGCVLYFLDGDEAVGLLKCKNAYYIICRAMRERICGFMNAMIKAEDALDPAHTVKQLKNIMQVPEGEKRNMVFENVFQGLYALIQHKVQTALYQSSRRLKGRLEELAVSYVPITKETRVNWTKAGESLMEKLARDFLDSFAETFTPAVHALQDVICGAQEPGTSRVDVTDTEIEVNIQSFSQGIESLDDAFFEGHGDRSPGAVSLPVPVSSPMKLDANRKRDLAHPHGDHSGSETDSVVSSSSAAAAAAAQQQPQPTPNATNISSDDVAKVTSKIEAVGIPSEAKPASSSSGRSNDSADPRSIPVKTALKQMWDRFIESAQPFTSEAVRRRWPDLWTEFVAENRLHEELKIHLRS